LRNSAKENVAIGARNRVSFDNVIAFHGEGMQTPAFGTMAPRPATKIATAVHRVDPRRVVRPELRL